MNTYEVPGAREILRAASRSLRFARFRDTALPTFFPATKPTSGIAVCPIAWITVTPPLRLREPVRYTVANRDPETRERYNPDLGGEFVAALGAATFDECPAGAIAHASTEAVFPLAAAIVRLIRTLHSEVVPSWGSRGASVESRNGDILGMCQPNRHRQRDTRKVQRGRETHNRAPGT